MAYMTARLYTDDVLPHTPGSWQAFAGCCIFSPSWIKHLDVGPIVPIPCTNISKCELEAAVNSPFTVLFSVRSSLLCCCSRSLIRVCIQMLWKQHHRVDQRQHYKASFPYCNSASCKAMHSQCRPKMTTASSKKHSRQ